MNRTEFIQMLGLGAVASVVPMGGEEKIETKEEGKDYEKLYQILRNGEPVEIAGIEFLITDMAFNIDRDGFGRAGRKSIDLSLTSTNVNEYSFKVNRHD